MIDDDLKTPELNSVTINTDIWNNQVVVQMTGLTIEMLSNTLYNLAEFIKSNLMPNHLQYFGLGGLLGVKNI